MQLYEDCFLYLWPGAYFTTYTAFGDVVWVMHDVPGQAKVADLDKFALTDQHIPGSKVTMDALRWKNVQNEIVVFTHKDRV